jgi:hypothetical protein
LRTGAGKSIVHQKSAKTRITTWYLQIREAHRRAYARFSSRSSVPQFRQK